MHHPHGQHNLRIFISAAEPSGDMHAASLMREILARRPETQFVGVAGDQMRDVGCESVADMTKNAAMLTGALGNAGKAVETWSATTRQLTRRHFDAAVVIDSPMLNLPIAARTRARGVPTLYYVAPQLWAWGRYRMHKVKARVDKLACVLPFEQDFFVNLGFDATYVGHPLFDRLSKRPPDPNVVAQIRSAGSPVIAILPGSRGHVVSEVLPGQLEVARTVRRRFGRAHIGISVANETAAEVIGGILQRTKIPATLYSEQNAGLLTAADLTLVASGTATLEVAYYGSPMIVMYNGSRLMYHLIGRWLIDLKHLSLVNILAGRELVPEFMPYYESTQPIARRAIEMLSSPGAMADTRAGLAKTISTISQPGASGRTAELLLSMINEH